MAYPCEIWPYHLRARGLTVSNVTTVLALFFNTFVNPIALDRIGWKYYLVFVAVIIAFGLTAFFYYPETRGHTLESMIEVFDGVDQVQLGHRLGLKEVENLMHGTSEEKENNMATEVEGTR